MSNLQKRTCGEDFWLARKNESKSQVAYAKKYKLPVKRYQKVERDEESLLRLSVPFKPTLGQLCALARKRLGFDLRKTASLLGLSHVTLLKMERDNDPKLVVKWKRLGFKF